MTAIISFSHKCTVDNIFITTPSDYVVPPQKSKKDKTG